MKKAFLFISILVFSANIFAQRDVPVGFDLSNYGVKVEPDKRLMTVLATLELARTTSDSGGGEASIKTPLSAQGIVFRERLQADLKEVDPKFQQRVSLFIENYKKRHPKSTNAEIVAPFISMAYTLTPVPELADPVITNDLPGELLDVLDFAPLVREFYRRTAFAGKINEYVKDYRMTSDTQLRGSAKEMVKELLDYLHTRPQVYYTERIKTETSKIGSKKGKISNISQRRRERRFFIVPELLAPNGNISFLNIGDDYYAIVPPDVDLTKSEVRRGFLQFVFDPLVAANAKEVSTIRPNIKLLLDERRKTNPNVSPDVYRAVSRSLVAAADARQNEFEKVRIATAQARQNIIRMKTEAEKKAVSAELARFTEAAADETAAQLSEAYEEGAVLSFYFAEQLKGLEDSGFDVASSMREMILSLDTTKETNRLEQFAAARKRGEENRKKTSGTTVAIENPVTNRLLEIQKIIEAKNFSLAQTQLKQLLEKNPSEPRIFYNIGRVASLTAESIEDVEQRKAKLLEAKVAYENVLRSATSATERALISLSYVGLARIYEFYDEKAYAIKIYDAAIKVGDVSGGAFREAMAGKERLLKDQ